MMTSTPTMEDFRNYFSGAADKAMRSRHSPATMLDVIEAREEREEWIKKEKGWAHETHETAKSSTYMLLHDNNKQFMRFSSVSIETLNAFDFRNVLIRLNDGVISPQTNILWC